MARAVPNNPIAFPPSMKVRGIGTTTWKWEVELRLEQQPRVESGTETENNAGAVVEEQLPRSSCLQDVGKECEY